MKGTNGISRLALAFVTQLKVRLSQILFAVLMVQQLSIVNANVQVPIT